MRLVVLSSAERDLAALVDFIADDNPSAALQVFDTIWQSVNRLADFPQLGRKGRVERTRELVVPGLPYIIVYALTEQEVWILAVLHTSRKWPESFPTK